MSDELKRDYQEKLGDKFGAIVNGVSYDWANGLVRLNEYRALFGDPANIEFINTFSGPFMSDVQQLFWRDLFAPHHPADRPCQERRQTEHHCLAAPGLS